MKKFIKFQPVTVVEWMLTYVSLGWAYVLFTSPHLFEMNPSFSEIGAIVNSEWIMGVIVTICALTKMIGMFIGSVTIRKIGLLMSTFLWIMVATSMLIATGGFNASTGFIVYSALAVMSLWTSKEVTKSDRV